MNNNKQTKSIGRNGYDIILETYNANKFPIIENDINALVFPIEMKRDVEGEIYHLDTMITALVELLEEKGILGYEEWENKIREKLEEVKELTKFEDLDE